MCVAFMYKTINNIIENIYILFPGRSLFGDFYLKEAIWNLEKAVLSENAYLIQKKLGITEYLTRTVYIIYIPLGEILCIYFLTGVY